MWESHARKWWGKWWVNTCATEHAPARVLNLKHLFRGSCNPAFGIPTHSRHPQVRARSAQGWKRGAEPATLLEDDPTQQAIPRRSKERGDSTEAYRQRERPGVQRRQGDRVGGADRARGHRGIPLLHEPRQRPHLPPRLEQSSCCPRKSQATAAAPMPSNTRSQAVVTACEGFWMANAKFS